jgi:TonB-linked SusC/RagA family outer membrane protein
MRRAIFIFVGFLLISSSLFSQIKVEGQIKNRTGEPLPGVNVVVKGTATGAISDIDGNYAISSVPANGTLVFSFIGMTSQEVSVNSRTKIDVVMADDIQSLDEVVAIGYGMVRKRDLTGAVSSVKSDEIKMAPVVNVMEAMQGRVAGLDITRSSGRSGSEPEVLLRGNRSLTASSSPLYIIDGIPGSISTLNPNDIQSIEVLKDASSTAIYGSAGANGVIIVTTKQAEKGKVKVDVDAYYGVNSFPSYPRALQGDAWFNYLEAGYFRAYGKNSASRNELLTAYSLSPEQLNPYIDAGKWIDWVDETLQTGTQQNYNVSLRGGTDRTQGYFSMGLNSEKGIYKNDQTNTLTMRTGVTHILSDWAKAGVQTTLSWRDRDSRGSRINKTYGTIPLGDVYDADGNIKPEPIDGNSSVSLIADDVDGVYINNSKQIRVTANPFVEITPIKDCRSDRYWALRFLPAEPGFMKMRIHI